MSGLQSNYVVSTAQVSLHRIGRLCTANCKGQWSCQGLLYGTNIAYACRNWKITPNLRITSL